MANYPDDNQHYPEFNSDVAALVNVEARAKCDRCGGESWYMERGDVQIQAETCVAHYPAKASGFLPCAVLTCQRCGNTIFHNTRILHKEGKPKGIQCEN